MHATTDILCSRCGTPFPRERGKVPANCVVCQELRPDLDSTLEGEDRGAAALVRMAMGGTTAAARPATPALKRVAPAPARPYVAMSDAASFPPITRYEEPLTELLGPVVLLAPPALGAMAGALAMLNLAPNFQSGSWYAVICVAFLTFALSMGSGLALPALCYYARVRHKWLLRVLYLLPALAVLYPCITLIPPHVDVRPGSLPAFRR